MAVVYANGGELLKYWRKNDRKLSPTVIETRTIVVDGKDKRISTSVSEDALELITDEKEKASLKKQLEQIDFPQFAQGRRGVDNFTEPKQVRIQKNGVFQVSGLHRFFNITKDELQVDEPHVLMEYDNKNKTVIISRIKY